MAKKQIDCFCGLFGLHAFGNLHQFEEGVALTNERLFVRYLTSEKFSEIGRHLDARAVHFLHVTGFLVIKTVGTNQLLQFSRRFKAKIVSKIVQNNPPKLVQSVFGTTLKIAALEETIENCFFVPLPIKRRHRILIM